MGDDQEMMSRCDQCGAVVPEDGWFALEVARPGSSDDAFDDLLGAVFCRQEHAAQWLQQPLPEREPAEPYVPSARDRLVDGGVMAALIVTVGFAVVGLIATARWIWLP